MSRDTGVGHEGTADLVGRIRRALEKVPPNEVAERVRRAIDGAAMAMCEAYGVQLSSTHVAAAKAHEAAALRVLEGNPLDRATMDSLDTYCQGGGDESETIA